MSALPKYRWFQFSLKTLLVIITLLCLGPGGYVAYEQNKVRRQREAVEAIGKLGGIVVYDHSAPARSATMRQILGDESFGNVAWVRFDNSRVTDADLVHLTGMVKLERLYLDSPQVTDAGLAKLTGLKSLEYLILDNTQTTSAGVAKLGKALPNCVIFR